MRSLFRQMRLFVRNFIADVKQAYRTANRPAEFFEKVQDSFFQRVLQFFGRSGTQFTIVVSILVILCTVGYSFVQDDFRLLKNIQYAIKSEEVIEEKIANLERENERIKGKYEEIQRNYEELLKAFETHEEKTCKKSNQ